MPRDYSLDTSTQSELVLDTLGLTFLGHNSRGSNCIYLFEWDHDRLAERFNKKTLEGYKTYDRAEVDANMLQDFTFIPSWITIETLLAEALTPIKLNKNLNISKMARDTGISRESLYKYRKEGFGSMKLNTVRSLVKHKYLKNIDGLIVDMNNRCK